MIGTECMFGGDYKQTAMQALAKTQIHEIMLRKKYKKCFTNIPRLEDLGSGTFPPSSFCCIWFLLLCVSTILTDTWERTCLSIFFAWILSFNLNNWGANILLCKSNCCFGRVLWKKTKHFRFAGTFITSISKEKGLFYIFLRLELFNIISRIEAKSLD